MHCGYVRKRSYFHLFSDAQPAHTHTHTPTQTPAQAHVLSGLLYLIVAPSHCCKIYMMRYVAFKGIAKFAFSVWWAGWGTGEGGGGNGTKLCATLSYLYHTQYPSERLFLRSDSYICFRLTEFQNKTIFEGGKKTVVWLCVSVYIVRRIQQYNCTIINSVQKT